MGREIKGKREVSEEAKLGEEGMEADKGKWSVRIERKNMILESPFFFVVVVDCIDDNFLPVFHNFPNGAPHHVTSRMGSDSQAVTLA